MTKIKNIQIYPTIGIARVGNSKDEFFIGPESPGQVLNSELGFKDKEGAIKRQAARFRLYAYDDKGNIISEITDKDATIEWSVHLVNKKGSWFEFKGRYHLDEAKLRNLEIQGDKKPNERTQLIINPGVKNISGINKKGVVFDGGKFDGKEVCLGELKTDDEGRLLVLGGYGHSSASHQNALITNYANNDYWYDDTSDGIIEATITFKDGTKINAGKAHVLVAPPNFAPNINSIVTLYDIIKEVSDKKSISKDVNYYRDIHPIFERATLLAWVNENSNRGHGAGKRGNFLDPYLLKKMKDPSGKSESYRKAVLKRFRVPEKLADDKTYQDQSNLFFMPQLSGDDGDAVDGKPRTWLSVTVTQYDKLKKWAAGKFEVGKPEIYKNIDSYPLQERPEMLNRGTLEPCVGGPFYPGIEMTYISTLKETFKAPFKLKDTFQAGDITKYMAVPWQADFYECNTHWWPAQRPDNVVPEDEYLNIIKEWSGKEPPTSEDSEKGFELQAAMAYRPLWSRGLASNPSSSPDGSERPGDFDMVKYWDELGFVTKKVSLNRETVFVEQERTPFAGMDQRKLFYSLNNIDQFPEVLPKAKEFVEDNLSWAENYMNSDQAPDLWKYFSYSKELFEARMRETYSSAADSAIDYDPATDPVFKSREDVIQRIIQLAPFDLTDGAWLRNINTSGPEDEIRSLLFSILEDERGNGNPSMNHCNMYRDLCHDAGFYPHPVNSEKFANDPRFLDSAFTTSAFEMAISQFTDSYFPEIIGMTLQLEWGVLELKPTAKLLEYYGFDPHFYVLHIGIDNAVNGHGRRAIDTISLYLDEIRVNGGEEAVQDYWRRIWRGYVAFGMIGTLGQDLVNLINNKPTLKDKMIAMIESKEEFGSYNHDEKTLGANRINDWFSDPAGFMDELVKAGYIIPGNPKDSKFFGLLEFETGPMYRVFTNDEIQLWKDWTISLSNKSIPVPVTNVAQDMIQLIKTLKPRQTGSADHKTITLKSPADGAIYSISEWFNKEPKEFMAALSDPENKWIVKGSPDTSLFVTQLLSPANPMGNAFSGVIPNTGGKIGREIVIRWIEHNCAIPKVSSVQRKDKVWLTSHARLQTEEGLLIQGQGTLH